MLVSAIELVHERWRLRKQEKENELAVRQARDRAQTLLHEVNHRVANSLGLVAAMVRMQANALEEPPPSTPCRKPRPASPPSPAFTAGSMSTRISARSRSTITSRISRPNCRTPSPIANDRTASISSRRKLPFPSTRRVSLGVIVGELVTNAFKYAYPPETVGEIRISLEGAGQSSIRLVVEDDGKGFSDGVAARGTGLGSKIVSAMTTNLEGVLTRAASSKGAKFVLEFPIDPRREQSRAP